MVPRARRSYPVAFSVVALLAVLCVPQVVAAATFTVNVTADRRDISPGDGVCSAGPGPGGTEACSLRAAIMEINALGGTGVHEIVLPAGTFALSLETDPILGGFQEDERQNPFGFAEGAMNHDLVNDLDIGVNVEIVGAGEGRTIVQGRRSDRVFHVLRRTTGGASPTHVRIANLTVRGGFTASRGAGILFAAVRDAYLDDVTVESNTGLVLFHHEGSTYTAVGGGVHSQAYDLFVNRSTMRNNTAGAGGGLSIAGGWATVSDSTFSNNTAVATGSGGPQIIGASQGMGGGIAVLDAAPQFSSALDLFTSTLSGNHAADGGGLGARGHVRVVNSTLSGNTGGRGGGAYIRTQPGAGLSVFEFVTVTENTAPTGAGVYREFFDRSTFNLTRSIVAGNTPENCFSTGGARPLSAGYNLEDTNVCGFTQATDLPNTDPRLGPLGDSGGDTQTHDLASDSPAIDRAGHSSYREDQRGVRRPQGAAMDIGASERLRLTLTQYRIPDRFRIVFGFSLTVDLTGTSGARIRDIVPASKDVKLAVKIDKSGRSATVSAAGLNLDVDKLKQEKGQKRPVLFYVEVDNKDGGSEHLEIAQPRFDATLKDVTKLPIDQK